MIKVRNEIVKENCVAKIVISSAVLPFYPRTFSTQSEYEYMFKCNPTFASFTTQNVVKEKLNIINKADIK